MAAWWAMGGVGGFGRGGALSSHTARGDQERLCNALAVRGRGSLLRGFRQELDSEGSLCVGFLNFCKAVKRLGVSVDASRLWSEASKKQDSPDSLTLDDVAPEAGKLVLRFRRWMVKTFGGPGEMFLAFEAQEDSKRHGKVSRERFEAGCRSHGFEAMEEELCEIFCLLDVEETGALAMEDCMFLDMDKKRRQGAILKATNRSKLEQENLLAEVYREDSTKNLSRTHRLAPREWNAANIERLPALVHEKHKDWQRSQQQRASRAMATFMAHLNTTYGNILRAWRRGLDPDSHFTITRTELGRYCMRTNIHVDVATLWKTLDQDSDGVVSMEELGPRPAMALARLRKWLRERFESCAAAWDQLRTAAGPSEKWRSDKKMLCAAFMQALEQLGCPSADCSAGSQHGVLFGALDYYGCGFVSREDLEWLDRWPVTEWLSATPDAEAWAVLRRLMLESHGRPLRVWRSLLDTDNSNLVTWAEFQEACQAVGFRGNIGGAWCHLDQDVSGTISLQEFDPHTAEFLSSFKAWVQDHFGTVEFAFRSLDTDGSGSVSFSELKRGCLRLKWEGDAREIFECLDLDSNAGGRRTLSYKELDFLDSWEPNPWTWEEPEGCAKRIKEAERSSPQAERSSPQVHRSSRRLGKGAMSLPKLLTCESPRPSDSRQASPRPEDGDAASLDCRQILPRRQELSPKAGRKSLKGTSPKASSPYAAKLLSPDMQKMGQEGRLLQRSPQPTFSMPALTMPAAAGDRSKAAPAPPEAWQWERRAAQGAAAPGEGRNSWLAKTMSGLPAPGGPGPGSELRGKVRRHSASESLASPRDSAPDLPQSPWRGFAPQMPASRNAFQVISNRTVALAAAPG